MAEQPNVPEHLCRNSLADALLEDALTCQPLVRIGRYFSGIIHNLNGCLQNAQMQFELLQMSLQRSPNSSEPGKAERHLRHLAEELDHLSEMLRFWGQQVDFEELLREDWMDVNQAIHTALTFMEADPFCKHQVFTELNMQPDLPPIYGSAFAVNQVISALLENAIDAMRISDEQHLIITTREEDAHVAVIIQDSGCGLPEGMGDPSRPGKNSKRDVTEPRTGLRFHIGLGLYLAHRLVASLGGRITWQSRPGKTVFTLCLPISKAPLLEAAIL